MTRPGRVRAVLLFGLTTVCGLAADWKPVSPADLALDHPLVDEHADAEALFWEVRLDAAIQEESRVVLDHYIRIKIFNSRGAEAQSIVELEPFASGSVEDIQGRTILPDGSILELESDAIFDRSLVRSQYFDVHAKSFVLPGVVAGSLVEYQWREVRDHGVDHMPLRFQRDIPIREVKYYIRPPTEEPLRSQAFHCDHSVYQEEADAFVSTTLLNVPAPVIEEFMPPRLEVTPWVLLYHPMRRDPAWKNPGLLPPGNHAVAAFDPLTLFPASAREAPRLELEEERPPRFAIASTGFRFGSDSSSRASDAIVTADDRRREFWSWYAHHLIWLAYDGKPPRGLGRIRKAAKRIVGDALTADERLDRIYEFCRTQIVNTDNPGSVPSGEISSRLKRNKRPADTLKRGAGTSGDIRALFGALAAAADFEVGTVLLSDRSRAFFNPDFLDPYFLTDWAVGVLLGKGLWYYFDPSQPYLPPRMLPWQHEGVGALVVRGLTGGVLGYTRVPPARDSLAKRTADLRLSSDGTAEARVRVELSGHLGIREKRAYGHLTDPERLERLRRDVGQRLPGAEIREIVIENATSYAGNFTYEYSAVIPNYAQTTDSRILLQPAYFQRGLARAFTSATRQHDVYFPFPWSEQDQVSIEAPAGYELEGAESPQSIRSPGFGSYEVSLNVEEGRLVYRRASVYCEGGTVVIPSHDYPRLKQLFDIIRLGDDHTVALQRLGSEAETGTPAPSSP